MAKLHKPVIFATGVAHLEDIERAMNVCREEGNEDVILLKCVSAYPTPYEDVNLRMIPTLSQTFGCLTGLSDHTMGGGCRCRRRFPRRADGGKAPDLKTQRRRSGWRIFHGAPGI